MQSPKRSSQITTIPKPVTYSYSTRNVIRKKCSSTQTCRNIYLDLLQENILTFDEDSRRAYVLALGYINKFHNFMNKELNEQYGECGDSNIEGNYFFKLPEIPNYANIFKMILEKTKHNYNLSKSKEEENKNTDILNIINKPSTVELDCKSVETHYKFNEILNMKNHNQYFEMDGKSLISETQVPISSKTEFIKKEIQENLNYVEKVVIYSQNLTEEDNERKNTTNENNDLDYINYGNDRTETESLGNLTIKENIEHFSNNENQYMNENNEKDVAVLKKKSFIELVKRKVEEEFLTYFNKNNIQKSKQTRLVKSNFNIVTIQPQINLLEYAQKKLERQTNLDFDSSQSINKYNVYNNFNACNSSENHYNMPKRIRDMFKKISSKENIRDYEHEDENCSTNLYSIKDQSDSDSIILDDEEFEKMNRSFQKEQLSDEEKFRKIIEYESRGSKREERRERRNNLGCNQEKCHPLKLNGKDMTKLNEKMLSAIGLFTERGDIRPGIIDILEEKKRVKSKDSRNKQFRSKRQWDLQIHLEPKTHLRPSLTSISSDKSFISVSSDAKSDFECDCRKKLGN